MFNIDNVYLHKLLPIHQNLKGFEPQTELNNEIPEQLMAVEYIRPDDCVLELGGSIGRNSCVINSILNNKENHVVVEPSKKEAEKLRRNRDNNNLKFSIEESAISNVQLYSRGWSTFTTPVKYSVPVNIISLQELRNKYNVNFNVLVIDNEGNFVSNLKVFPDILQNIRLILIEHDFNSKEDLDFFTK